MVSARSSSVELRLLFGRLSAVGCLTIAIYEYTHQVVLTKLVVFSTNDLVEDRLCVLIPMICPTAVTNPKGDFGTTKDTCPLAETDPFTASGDVATLTKIAALQRHVRRTWYPRIVKPRYIASHKFFTPMCELLHTVSANKSDMQILPGQSPSRRQLVFQARREPACALRVGWCGGAPRGRLPRAVNRRTAGARRSGTPMFEMKRRKFITLLGSAAEWPLVASAHQPGRTRRVGVLMSFASDDTESHERIAAFHQGCNNRWQECADRWRRDTNCLRSISHATHAE